MTDTISKLLDEIERLKSDIKLKDVTTNELFVHHIDEKKEMKKDFFVRRRLLEQKHEEEVVRIESDILRIKVEMDQLERQLSSLVSRSECDGLGQSVRQVVRVVSGSHLTCRCPPSGVALARLPPVSEPALPEVPRLSGDDDAPSPDLSVQQRALRVSTLSCKPSRHELQVICPTYTSLQSDLWCAGLSAADC